jgi:hypothetical protein
VLQLVITPGDTNAWSRDALQTLESRRKNINEPRAQSCSQSRGELAGFFISLTVYLHHHQTSLCITSTSTTKHFSQPNRQNFPPTSKTLTHQQSCLASPAVPPLRPSAPPSLLPSLALRPSSPRRLARPAPSPSLLPTSTLLHPPPLLRLRLQRAAVAVSSARWPALLRKSPQAPT